MARDLSIFVDESGDRDGKARYYLLTLVIHDQADSISDKVARYEESLLRYELPSIPFHSEPLLNGHGPYRGMPLKQRKKMLYSFNELARRLPIEYTGLNRHQYDSSVGLFDTALSAEDYARMKLQDSLLNPDGTTRDRDNAMVVTSEIVDARGGSESDKPKKHVKILNLGGSREAAASPQEAKPRAGAPLKRDWSTTPWSTRALSLSMPVARTVAFGSSAALSSTRGWASPTRAPASSFLSVAARRSAAVPPGGLRATPR